MEKKRNKTYYYKDELEDDFADNGIKTKKIGEDYIYIHTNPFYRFFNILFRHLLVIPILYIATKFSYRTKIVNRKVLKEVRKKGYFLYSNHTCNYDPINHAVMMDSLRFTGIIASADAFSIPGLSWLISALGAFPVPENAKMYRNFKNCIKYHIEKNHKIVVYPEAHIWPYYTGIRDFKSVSFRYPVDLDAPIVIATTTFRKRKWSNMPKVVIYLDGPFYPDKNLNYKDQVNDLRDKAYNCMVQRTSIKENYAFNQFIKVEDSLQNNLDMK